MTRPYALLAISAVLLWGVWAFTGKLALGRGMAPTRLFVVEAAAGFVLALAVLGALGVGVGGGAGFGGLLGGSAGAPTPGGGGPALQGSWNVWGVVSGVAMAAGLLVYYLALERGPVSVITPLTASYPAVAVLLGVALLGERPAPHEWVGVALVLLGTGVLVYPR